MNPRMSVSKTALAAFSQEQGIKRLAVFGSALRDNFGSESDFDVLVEFEPDRIPGLLDVAGIEVELFERLACRKVDLPEVEVLSHYFRQDVLEMAELQYAKGGQNLHS